MVGKWPRAVSLHLFLVTLPVFGNIVFGKQKARPC